MKQDSPQFCNASSPLSMARVLPRAFDALEHALGGRALIEQPKVDRRDPMERFYLPVTCPLGKKCSNTDCSLAHNQFERIFHPLIYKVGFAPFGKRVVCMRWGANSECSL